MLSRLESRYTYHPDKHSYAEMGRFSLRSDFLSGSMGRIHVLSALRKSDAAVLFLHGNRGNVSNYADYCALYERLGITFVAVDYPGYGESEGEPTEAGLYESATLAWNFAKEVLGLKEEQLVVHGLSLGGAVGVYLASQTTPRALIVESSFTSTHDMGRIIFPRLPIYKLIPNRYNSISRISKLTSPLLLLHGDCDTVIPISHSQQLFERAAHPKFFETIKGARHDNTLRAGGKRYEDLVRHFIAECTL